MKEQSISPIDRGRTNACGESWLAWTRAGQASASCRTGRRFFFSLNGEWSARVGRNAAGLDLITSLRQERRHFDHFKVYGSLARLRLLTSRRRARRPGMVRDRRRGKFAELPQLHPAITENRKSNNPVILVSGKAQLESSTATWREVHAAPNGTTAFAEDKRSRPLEQWVRQVHWKSEFERLREDSLEGARAGRKLCAGPGRLKTLVWSPKSSGLADLIAYRSMRNIVTELRISVLR